MEKKVNHLANRELLNEIHKSKNTYCEYTETQYSDYDLIAHSDYKEREKLKEAALKKLMLTNAYAKASEQERERLKDACLATLYTSQKYKRAEAIDHDGRGAATNSILSVLYESEDYKAADTLTREEMATQAILSLCTTPDFIAAAKAGKADRLAAQAKRESGKRPKINVDDIPTEGLVFRILTFSHIPLATSKKKKSKTTSNKHMDVPFHPFKHYVLGADGSLTEVGKSHWKNGKFSASHGKITEQLAKMFILLVDRYSQRSNWRGYTYLDEMAGQALLQLSQMALRFNEHKSDNPFSYYTAFTSNAFTRVLNTEKKMQNIRDDILEQHGLAPSFSRQMDYEELVNDHYNTD